MNKPVSPAMLKRLAITRELNIKEFIELMIAEGQPEPTEQQALAALHKARYWFAKNGYLDKKYRADSRRWLVRNGFNLPEEKTTRIWVDEANDVKHSKS